MISDQLRSRANDLSDIAHNPKHYRASDVFDIAFKLKLLAHQVAELERNVVPAECRRLPDAALGDDGADNVVSMANWRARR